MYVRVRLSMRLIVHAKEAVVISQTVDVHGGMRVHACLTELVWLFIQKHLTRPVAPMVAAALCCVMFYSLSLESSRYNSVNVSVCLLHPLQVSNMENSNTRSELERIKNKVLQQLQSLPPVPSVPVAVMPPGTKVRQTAKSRGVVVALVEGRWLLDTFKLLGL